MHPVCASTAPHGPVPANRPFLGKVESRHNPESCAATPERALAQPAVAADLRATGPALLINPVDCCTIRMNRALTA